MFVLDASVALRWFLDKPIPAYACRVRQLLLAGDQAIVPALWHLEMANSLAIAERRKILRAADVDQALVEIENLVSLFIRAEASSSTIRQAFTTARLFGLSAYDATYLHLARRESLPLATLDDQLRAAARKTRVDIV